MFSAQCKIFGSKKVKQLGLSFTEILERCYNIQHMLQDEDIANEWEIICCLFHNLIDLCVEIYLFVNWT